MAECRLSQSVPAVRVPSIGYRDSAAPGSYAFVRRYDPNAPDRNGPICGLTYACPGCGKVGYVGFKPPSADDVKYARATWDWDGNESSPTLVPSIHNHDVIYEGKPLAEQPTHWHGWLRAGMWVQA